MTWRTWASLRASSARSEYSTRAVGFCTPPPIRPRYCGPSSFSPSSRRPRASFVAVPSDGMRSPRTRREIVEWSTPDCWASCRCDIFLALSCARSHSLKARPLVRVMPRIINFPRIGPYPPFVQAASAVGVACQNATRWVWCGPPRTGAERPCDPRRYSRRRLCTTARTGARSGGRGGHSEPAALRRDRVDDRADDDDRQDADRPVDQGDRQGIPLRDVVHERQQPDDAALDEADARRR